MGMIDRSKVPFNEKNKNFILNKDEFQQGKSSEQGRRQIRGGEGGGGASPSPTISWSKFFFPT